MNSIRVLVGWLCIVIGFALVVLLGLGAFEPINHAAEVTSLTPALVAMLPSVSIGIAPFAVGVWLITTRKSK